jgi:hypothetical protein
MARSADTFRSTSFAGATEVCRPAFAYLVLVATLALPAVGRADRQNTRFTQEADSAEWNHGYPFPWRLGLHYDVYFASIGDDTDSEAYDFGSRRHEMVYDMTPISTLTASAVLAYRRGGFGKPVRTLLSYGTSRAFGQGGDVSEKSASPMHALGFHSRATDLIDAGLEYLGFAGRIALHHFALGTAREVDASSGATVSSRTFVMDRIVGRAEYNFRPFELFDEVDGQFRPYRPFGFTLYAQMQDYTLPRILYRVRENGDPGPDDYRYTYLGETAAQSVRTRTYALGGTVIMMLVKSRDLSFTGHVEAGGSFGGGPIEFDDGDRHRSETLYTGTGDMAALTSLRIPLGAGLLELSLQYNVELAKHFTGESNGAHWETGTLDAFHGPRVEAILRL